MAEHKNFSYYFKDSLLQGYGIKQTDDLKAATHIVTAVIGWLASGMNPVGLGLTIIDLYIKTECKVVVRLLWLAAMAYICVPVAPWLLVAGAAHELVNAVIYASLKTRGGG